MSTRVKPMLCHKYPGYLPDGQWVAEQKFDGHRMIVHVTDGDVRAFSRASNERPLPARITEELVRLPNGIYDGELVVPGGHSSDVVDLSKRDKLVLILFDALESTCDLRDQGLLTRTTFLSNATMLGLWTSVISPMQTRVVNHEHVLEIAERVWAEGGEGLVLKRVGSRYHEGKRSRDWLKLKRVRSATLTIVGFESGLLGPHSIVLLEDPEGFQTSVKVLDDAELALVEADPGKLVGRKLMIEYQERTTDGAYRHPRWDRWEDQ